MLSQSSGAFNSTSASSEEGRLSGTYTSPLKSSEEVRSGEIQILVRQLSGITLQTRIGSGIINKAATVIRDNLGYEPALAFIGADFNQVIADLATKVSQNFSIPVNDAKSYIGYLYYKTYMDEESLNDGSVTPRTQAVNVREQLTSFSTEYSKKLASTMEQIKQIKSQSVMGDAVADLDKKITDSFNRNRGNLVPLNAELSKLIQEILVDKLMKSKGFSNKDNMLHFFDVVSTCHNDMYSLAYEHAETLTMEVKLLLNSYGYTEQSAFELILNVYQYSRNDLKITTTVLGEIRVLSQRYQECVRTTAPIAFTHIHQQWVDVGMQLDILRQIVSNQIAVQRQIQTKSRQYGAIQGRDVLTTWGKYRLAWNDGHASNPAKSQACYNNPRSSEAKKFYEMFKSPNKQSGCSSCCGQAAVEVREPVSEGPH